MDIAAGTMGGLAVVLVGHPFDTTKTRLQTAPVGFYTTTLDCVRKTLRWEGFAGFYTGIWSPITGQMFLRACSFTTFHNTLKYQISHDPNSNGHANLQQLFISGAVAGFCLAFIESPIDFIKTRLQCQIFEQQQNSSFKPKYRTVIECVKYKINNYGFMSLYRGFWGTMIRNVPANSVFFPVNELVKRYFAKRDGIPVGEVSISQNLIAGGCAGLCYWVGTFPLDVVKARMQSADIQKKISWLGTVRHVYRSGGLRAFRNGIVPCVIRAIPACGTMFTVVDYIRKEYGS